jgi:hypothetical protein
MPRVGFEPAIPVFERANEVHALDHAATVIGETLIGKPEEELSLYTKITFEWICMGRFHLTQD